MHVLLSKLTRRFGTPRFGTSRLAILLSLIVFDVFLVCAAEHVGLGRPSADASEASSCLTVPDDGTGRLLDKLRQPEVLAVEPNPIEADFGAGVIFDLVKQSGGPSSSSTGPRPVSHLPLHLRLCVWLV
jgi:hypothetical protein